MRNEPKTVLSAYQEVSGGLAVTMGFGVFGFISIVVLCIFLKRYITETEYRPVDHDIGTRLKILLIVIFCTLLLSLLTLSIIGLKAP